MNFSTFDVIILGLQSFSRAVAHNVSHSRRLDPTMELITYSFVLYLCHGRHDVKCKPSIRKVYCITCRKARHFSAKFTSNMVGFSERNTNICKFCQLEAIFSVFYNISHVNFAILLILIKVFSLSSKTGIVHSRFLVLRFLKVSYHF